MMTQGILRTNIRIPIAALFGWILAALSLSSSFCCCHGFSILSENRGVALASTKIAEIPSSFSTRRSSSSSSTQTRTLLSLSSAPNEEEGSEETNDNDAAESDANTGIDVSMDERLYRLRLSRFTGIEWGTDLSFSFVYVREMDPTGAASMSGEVEIGDQLCELKAVVDASQEAEPPINLVGAPFDYVMSAFAGLERGVAEVDLVLFRGTKDELKVLCTGDGTADEPDTVTITVIQNKGSAEEQTQQIVAPAGCNVREVLTNNNINVYQSITRWTNCKGKQLCGTCIVNINEGASQTNRKSMDEASTLRENPDSYRLSCVTFAYGDITVETFPPIKAAQWTR